MQQKITNLKNGVGRFWPDSDDLFKGFYNLVIVKSTPSAINPTMNIGSFTTAIVIIEEWTLLSTAVLLTILLCF